MSELFIQKLKKEKKIGDIVKMLRNMAVELETEVKDKDLGFNLPVCVDPVSDVFLPIIVPRRVLIDAGKWSGDRGWRPVERLVDKRMMEKVENSIGCDGCLIRDVKKSRVVRVNGYDSRCLVAGDDPGSWPVQISISCAARLAVINSMKFPGGVSSLTTKPVDVSQDKIKAELSNLPCSRGRMDIWIKSK